MLQQSILMDAFSEGCYARVHDPEPDEADANAHQFDPRC